MKRILTYGTFDLLHYGHIRLLKRAKKRITHMKQERKCLKQSDMLTL